MHYDYSRFPVVTTSEQDPGGTRSQATLLDVVEGLRAQVKGKLPANKPACPTAVTTRLPCSTKEDTLRRETKIWTARLRKQQGTQAESWASQLAAAELSSWNSWELERTAYGHQSDTHRNLDRVVSQDECGNDLTHHEVVGCPRWKQELAAAELREVLVLHLTAKEVEALEQKANGEAVTDRHTLARAQRKAQAALRS